MNRFPLLPHLLELLALLDRPSETVWMWDSDTLVSDYYHALPRGGWGLSQELCPRANGGCQEKAGPGWLITKGGWTLVHSAEGSSGWWWRNNIWHWNQGSSVRLRLALKSGFRNMGRRREWCYEVERFGMRATNKDEDAGFVFIGFDLMMKEGLSNPSCLYFSLTHFQIWAYHLTHI